MLAELEGGTSAWATRIPGTATLLASGGSTSFARPAHVAVDGVIGALHGGGQPGLAKSGTSNFFASARSARIIGYARSCVESLIPPDMNPAAIDVPIATYSLNNFFVSGSPASLAKLAAEPATGPVGTFRSAHPASGNARTEKSGRINERRDTRTPGHAKVGQRLWQTLTEPARQLCHAPTAQPVYRCIGSLSSVCSAETGLSPARENSSRSRSIISPRRSYNRRRGRFSCRAWA